MIDPKDVTIIIPHLGESNEQEYSLNQCLQSIYETFEGKVLLVKNGNQKCNHSDISGMTIYNQGQCAAVNAAVATTNTPWIFVTNDDMVYAPGWFELLQSGWEGSRVVKFDDEKKYCISPQLVEPRPGAPTFLVEFCGGAGGDFNKQKWLEFVKNGVRYNSGFRTGFNLPFLIRRDLWDIIGGYDITYDPWGSNSDSDLLYKIRLAGIQPYQNTNSIVYHFSQTSGTFEPRNQGAWQKNWDYFIEKWGFPRTDDGIWEASFEIPNEGRKFRPDWEGKYVN